MEVYGRVGREGGLSEYCLTLNWRNESVRVGREGGREGEK